MAGNAPFYISGPREEFPGLRRQERPRGGMFGGGGQSGLGDTIARVGQMILAANGNPLGGLLLNQSAEARQAEREAEARERQRLQALEDQRNNWLFQQQWQRDNPQPTELERLMQLGQIDPASPEGRALAAQAARNRANPMTAVDVVNEETGETERRWIRPPAGPAPPPVLNELPPGARPLPAGGAPSGARNFR